MTFTVLGDAEGTAIGTVALAVGATAFAATVAGGGVEGAGLLDGVTTSVDCGARRTGARVLAHTTIPMPPTTMANRMPAAAATA